MGSASSARLCPDDPATVLDSLFSDEFLRESWQRQPFIDRAAHPSRFATVADLDAVDALIASSASSPDTKLHVIKDGRAVPVLSSSIGRQEDNLLRAYKAYQSAQSLLLTQVHKQSQSIRRLCRALECRMVAHGVAVSRPVVANLYLAPRRTKGLSPHYDNHDTFVLQIDGQKHWKLYDPIDSFPVKRDASVPPSEDTLNLREEIVLQQGDALYLPRGFYHAAWTESLHSLHVTLSVFPCTWLDLLTRAAPLDAGLRESLPAGSAQDPDGTAANLIMRIREFLKDADIISGVARQLVNDFTDAQGLFPDAGFRQVTFERLLDLDTRVTRRYGTHARIKRFGEEVQLIFSGSGLTAPREMESVFKFAAETVTFMPRELPDVLSEEGKLQIVHELIAAGMLKVVA
jgi:hypothetical protein